MKRNRDEIARQINTYIERRPIYSRFATVLHGILGTVASSITPEAIVQTRAKTVASFAEKIQRPGKAEHYGINPLEDLTDLCGGRVILPTLEDVRVCCRLVEENFIVHWEDSEDKLSLLGIQEFGYLSNHYIASLDPDSHLAADIDDMDSLIGLKAEFQIRTFLQHGWTVIQHDYIYKPNFSFPDKIRRQFHRISAILEDADEEFERAIASLRIYEANYGAYMTKTEINDQIERLTIVLENIPDSSGATDLVLRIAKLARYVARWDVSIELLSRFTESGNSSILRELGVALYKSHVDEPDSPEYLKGQQYLEEAVKTDPGDVDALTALGGSYKRLDLPRALQYIERAYDIDPEDPYTAQNYFASRLAAGGDMRLVKDALPAIKRIVRISAKQIELGINIPWAYFNHGLFAILSGAVEDGMRSYLLGVRFTAASWMVTTHLRDIDSLASLDSEIPYIKLVRHFLLLGLAIRFSDREAVNRLREEIGALETDLDLPLVIIAGTTNANNETLEPALRTVLIDAFRSYEGTIISGSTASGVCELVGEVQGLFPHSVRSVGYIPGDIPDHVQVDERFTKTHKTPGSGFSILDPLHYWTDIALTGIDVTRVRLLGIGGGPIAGFEYRLALAMGAQVGILVQGAGSGTKLLQEPAWQEANLSALKSTPEAIADFLRR